MFVLSSLCVWQYRVNLSLKFNFEIQVKTNSWFSPHIFLTVLLIFAEAFSWHRRLLPSQRCWSQWHSLPLFFGHQIRPAGIVVTLRTKGQVTSNLEAANWLLRPTLEEVCVQRTCFQTPSVDREADKSRTFLNASATAKRFISFSGKIQTRTMFEGTLLINVNPAY